MGTRPVGLESGADPGFMANEVLKQGSKSEKRAKMGKKGRELSEQEGSELAKLIPIMEAKARGKLFAAGLAKEAPDIVGDALKYVVQSVGNGVFDSDKGTLEGWFAQKVNGLVIDRLKASNRNAVDQGMWHYALDGATDDERPRELADSASNVEDSMAKLSMSEAIQELGEYDPHTAEIMELFRQGMNQKAVAKKLGLSEEKVKKRRAQGLEGLREILEEKARKKAA